MVAGYFKTKLNVVFRVVLFAAAICLIAPETISSIVGIVIGIGALVLNALEAKKTTAKAA